MQKRKRVNWTINKKFEVFASVLVLIPLLCFSIFFTCSQIKNIKTVAINKYNKELDRATEYINTELNKMIDKSAYVISNNLVLDGLKQDYSENIMGLMEFNDFINLVFKNINIENNKYLDCCMIYFKNPSIIQSKYIDSINNIPHTEASARATDSVVSEIFWEPAALYDDETDEVHIVFYRPITIVAKNVGVFKASISLGRLLYYVENMIDDENIVFSYFDSNKNCLVNTGEGEKNVKGIEITKTLINGNEMKVIIRNDYLCNQYIKPIMSLLLWLIIIILFMKFAIRYAVSIITKRLNLFVDNLRKGDFKNFNRDDIQTNDEIAVIEKNFTKLLLEMDKMHHDALLMLSKNKASQMELLQAKINPHLLHNSLSAINWEAQKNGQDEISRLVNILSSYYRSIFGFTENVVMVSQEIEILKSFISVTEMSYHTKYNVKFELDDRLMREYMYKMLLQPLVENAISHGIHENPGAELSIRAKKRGEFMIFEIEDTGYGMTEEKLNDLIQGKSGGEHYGIRNIRERIEIFYGNKGKLEIFSKLGEGTKVIVEIPAYSKEQLQLILEGDG